MNKTLGKLHIVKELPGLWMGPHPGSARVEWRGLVLLMKSMDSYACWEVHGLFMRIHRGGEVGRWMGWGGEIDGLLEEVSGDDVMRESYLENLGRFSQGGGE